MLRAVQEFLELLDRYRLVKECKRTGPELLHARDAAAVDFSSMFGGESGLIAASANVADQCRDHAAVPHFNFRLPCCALIPDFR